jgi:hypothetical protein
MVATYAVTGLTRVPPSFVVLAGVPGGTASAHAIQICLYALLGASLTGLWRGATVLEALTHLALGHASLTGLTRPTTVFVAGVSGAVAIGIDALVGYKVDPVYGEEAKVRPAMVKATFAALAFHAACTSPKQTLQKRHL